MIAEASHHARFAADPRHASVVESPGLHDGDRNVALEPRVVRQVDAFSAALAEEALRLVAPTGKRTRQGGRLAAGRGDRDRFAARVAEPGAAAELHPATIAEPQVRFLARRELQWKRARR